MALALWVGGVLTAMAVRVIPARTLTSSLSASRLTLRAIQPTLVSGTGQGALVGVGALAVAPAAGPGVFLVSVLMGVVFMILNQGIAALFGRPGQVLAVLMAAVTLASGVVSTTPALLPSIASLLPITAPLEALQALSVGSGGGVASGVALLTLWLAVAGCLVLVAVMRTRTVTSRQFARPAVAP